MKKTQERAIRSERLLNCPFCGSDKIGIWPTGVLFPNLPKGFAVHCDVCNAAGHWDVDRTKAVKAWNTRQPANAGKGGQ